MVHIKKHAKGYQLFSKFNNMPLGPIRKSMEDAQNKDMRRYETFSKRASNLGARPHGIRQKGKIKYLPSASKQMERPSATGSKVSESMGASSQRKHKNADSIGSERIGGRMGGIGGSVGAKFEKAGKPRLLHQGFVGGGSSRRYKAALV